MRWFLLVASGIAWASPALACSFPGPTEFEIVANAADQTAPSMPQVQVVEVKRGDDWNSDEGCGGDDLSTCTGIAFLKLELSSSDDLTSSEALGFRIDDPSARLQGAGKLLALDRDSHLTLFLNGTDNGDHDLKFELLITAVDKAGNESAPTSLTTSSDGSKHCQLARDLPGGALSTLALLGLLSWSRRRATYR